MIRLEVDKAPDGPSEDQSLSLGGDRLEDRVPVVLHTLHVHHFVPVLVGAFVQHTVDNILC